jgi:hypothetical protein
LRAAFPLQDRAFLSPGLFADEAAPAMPEPYKWQESGRGGIGDD